MDVLRSLPSGAAFVTELAVLAGLSEPDLEAALHRLHSVGQVFIASFAAPDPHLVADLRVVVAVDDKGVAGAVPRAQTFWAAFLQDFLVQHRCS